MLAPPDEPPRGDICLSVAAAVGWAAVCALTGVAAALAGARASRGCRSGGDGDGDGDAYVTLGGDDSVHGAGSRAPSPPPVAVAVAEPLFTLHAVASESSLATT